MPAGRPLKFKDVKTLKKAIDKYFASCHIDGDIKKDYKEPYTITGLDNAALHTFLLKSQSNNGGEDNWSGYEYAIPLSPFTLLPVA